MNLQEKLELIKKNCVEVVTEEELQNLLQKKKKPVTYCGYETSGEVHLGHMVTVTKLIDLEKAGFKVKILFADWHTFLNKKGNWEFIHATVKLWEKVFKKLGLKEPEFVLGSSFQRTNQYLDDLMTLALDTTLNRALRSMQEVARDVDNATVSQMIYPLMQIVDIKHLGVDVAQAGIEQRKIHMLGREVLEKINWPQPICVHTPLVNSLKGPGTKMSSSDPSSLISVRDREEELKKKISKAYCNPGEVEGNPVLEIAKLVVFPHIKSFEVKRPEKFGGNLSFENYKELEKVYAANNLHPMDLKNSVTGYMTEILEPIRKVFE